MVRWSGWWSSIGCQPASKCSGIRQPFGSANSSARPGGRSRSGAVAAGLAGHVGRGEQGLHRVHVAVDAAIAVEDGERRVPGVERTARRRRPRTGPASPQRLVQDRAGRRSGRRRSRTTRPAARTRGCSRPSAVARPGPNEGNQPPCSGVAQRGRSAPRTACVGERRAARGPQGPSAVDVGHPRRDLGAGGPPGSGHRRRPAGGPAHRVRERRPKWLVAASGHAATAGVPEPFASLPRGGHFTMLVPPLVSPDTHGCRFGGSSS